MASLYTRKDSPYIWIRYYDKYEMDPRKRRKSASTKLPDTRSGWMAARKLIKQLNNGAAEKDIEKKFRVHLKKGPLLSQGREEFLAKKPNITDATITTYKVAVKHMIKACKDKEISKYTYRDYDALVKYFGRKDFSMTSRAIYTRHLKALWSYFVKQGYAGENIIIKIIAPRKDPEPIPFKMMQKILKYYEIKDKKQFYFVYFLLLTGMRRSSALVQLRDDIHLEDGVLRAINVKAKNTPFYFPISDELRSLLIRMDIEKMKTGRLFYYWSEKFEAKFFGKDIKKLVERGHIDKAYHLKQIRATFGSWLANAGVDHGFVKDLYNHTDQKITDQHYVLMQAKSLLPYVNKIKFKVDKQKKSQEKSRKST